MRSNKIAVLGGGSWGSTLAHHLGTKGYDVHLWEFNPDIAHRLNKERRLATLPSFRLHPSVHVTNDIGDVLDGQDMILSVTPSHTVRSTFGSRDAQKHLKRGALVISATKGIEQGTHQRMSEVIKEMFTDVGDIVILSGPSHAEEVAAGEPVALVAASTSHVAAKKVQAFFSADSFRIYTSDDPIGVELGGSLKNVVAVACGIVDGLSLGDNTKAALITRGLVEITRLGTQLGAHAVTFFGLSGLGDLIVTCNSRHSRNRLLGEKIGKGKTLEAALSEMTMVAEGVNSTRSARALAKSNAVETPIIAEVARDLFEKKSPRDSIKDLMGRQVGAEMEGIIL